MMGVILDIHGYCDTFNGFIGLGVCMYGCMYVCIDVFVMYCGCVHQIYSKIYFVVRKIYLTT